MIYNYKLLFALGLVANLVMGPAAVEISAEWLPDELSDMMDIDFLQTKAHPLDKLDALLAERKVDLETAGDAKELIGKVESFVSGLYANEKSVELEYNALQFIRFLARLADARGPKCSPQVLQDLESSIDELRERPEMGKMASLARQIGLKIMQQKCKPYLDAAYRTGHDLLTSDPNFLERFITSEKMASYKDPYPTFSLKKNEFSKLIKDMVGSNDKFGRFVGVESGGFQSNYGPNNLRLVIEEEVFNKTTKVLLEHCERIESGLGLVAVWANVIKTLDSENYNQELDMPNYFDDETLFADTLHRATFCSDLRQTWQVPRIRDAFIYHRALQDATDDIKNTAKKMGFAPNEFALDLSKSK